MRGATCYETSDRNGRGSTQEAIGENVRFIERCQRGGLVGAGFGLHAAFTLSDRTLAACAEANQSLEAPFHIHVAEDACDRGAVERLDATGILNSRTLAAHCIHVSAAERAMLARHGVNVVVNPQSNCNNAVGTAEPEGLARRGLVVGLGSDGYTPRIADEFRTALLLAKLRSRDPRRGYVAALANNRTIVQKLWGFDVGRIETGAAADLTVFDYYPPTPLTAGNALSHFLFGIAYAPVDSLIVNGKYVLREKHLAQVDERRVMRRAAARARALCERL